MLRKLAFTRCYPRADEDPAPLGCLRRWIPTPDKSILGHVAGTIGFAVVAVVALAVLVTPAEALDLPKRKSGLWEITTSREGAPKAAMGGSMQMCIDEKTDDLSRQLGENTSREMCAKRDIRMEGGRIVADSICKFGETTATSHSVISGRFDNTYDVDIHTTYEPPLMGMKTSNTTIKARWTGPCKAGQRPGDMVLPNGMTINVFDAEKAGAGKK